ncbi:hypothetical protein [Streptomyces sp. PsTaAH-124]|uniref:hypothetical protein n=1 Tax=Streptomyces sp. PsTaAH-124 TaxID=1157638 RepID=UPI00036E6513|nr:hypothetical protein [Streptomyces sp. PsTaAH-124]
MAKVETETKTVSTIKRVELALSLEEAEALATLTGHVMGDPVTSPRKYTDAVYFALRKAGVENKFKRELNGSVRFGGSAKNSIWV